MNLTLLKRDPQGMTKTERQAYGMMAKYVLSPRGAHESSEAKADATAALKRLEAHGNVFLGPLNKTAAPKTVTSAPRPSAPIVDSKAIAAAKAASDAKDAKLDAAIRVAFTKAFATDCKTMPDEVLLTKIFQNECNDVIGLPDACFEGVYRHKATGVDRAIRANAKQQFAAAFAAEMNK